MAAKDLTKEEPRDRDEELGGYRWLPRMIDKARATFAGTNGDYTHPCPGDKAFLAFIKMDPEEFREIIMRTETDDEVLAEMHAWGLPREGDANFVPYESPKKPS